MIPLLEGLERVAPLLSAEHVSEGAWSRIFSAAKGLPDAWYCAALESRLSRQDEQIDLLVCCRADDGGRENLRDALPALIASAPRSADAWRRVQDFCGAWARHSSEMHREVPFIWLELDLPASLVGPAAPFLFFCTQPGFLTDPLGFWKSTAGAESTEARQLRLVCEALGLLVGDELSMGILDGVRQCVQALPSGGHLLHAAPLAQRGLRAVRLVLTLPHPDVLTYLQRVRWPGPHGEVQALLRTLHASSPMVGVQLDVEESVGRALGIQFYYQGRDDRWGPLLDGLVERGLCMPEKRAPLSTWSGAEVVRFSSRGHPLRLRRELELKVVFRPEQPAEAKAYFGFGADFLLFGETR